MAFASLDIIYVLRHDQIVHSLPSFVQLNIRFVIYFYPTVNIGSQTRSRKYGSGLHWALAVIHMSEKRIQFYDSCRNLSDDKRYLKGLMQYLKDEHFDKKGCPLPDEDEWELVECTLDTPQQHNGFDCAVFLCMFCDFLSIDCPLTFSQEHINRCRELIALSIMKGTAIE